MPRLFVGNFEFEHELAKPRFPMPARLRRLNDELPCAWLAAADDGDFIWVSGVEPDFVSHAAGCGLPVVTAVADESRIPAGVELTPWGWTERLRLWAAQYGWSANPPPPPTVRAVNSRRFSFELEREWGVGPAGAEQISALPDLEPALGRLPGSAPRWVLKAEFGMSARQRVLGHGCTAGAAVMNWARRRLESGQTIFLEPWLGRIDEMGLQFTVPPEGDGPPVLEGLTPLLTDHAGAYRGSRFAVDADIHADWRDAVEIGTRAALRAQRAGYFGPLGIDAMRSRDAGGQVGVRPLQDVNARWTMGRLALGLRRRLRPGEVGSWLHVRWKGASADENRRRFDELAAAMPAGVRVVRTSPFEVGGRPVSLGTLALMARSMEELSAGESIMLLQSPGGEMRTLNVER